MEYIYELLVPEFHDICCIGRDACQHTMNHSFSPYSLITRESTPLSLSTIVLNSRDWSEIIWLPKNSYFKINLPIGLYPKKPAGMHWLGRNDAVP